MATKKSYNEMIEGAGKREISAVHKEVREYYVKNKWRDTVSRFKIAPTVLTTIVGDIIKEQKAKDDAAKKERKLERDMKRGEKAAKKRTKKKAPKKKPAAKKKPAKKSASKKAAKKTSRKILHPNIVVVASSDQEALVWLIAKRKKTPKATISELIADLV
jgi:hypothetical protein